MHGKRSVVVVISRRIWAKLFHILSELLAAHVASSDVGFEHFETRSKIYKKFQEVFIVIKRTGFPVWSEWSFKAHNAVHIDVARPRYDLSVLRLLTASELAHHCSAFLTNIALMSASRIPLSPSRLPVCTILPM